MKTHKELTQQYKEFRDNYYYAVCDIGKIDADTRYGDVVLDDTYEYKTMLECERELDQFVMKMIALAKAGDESDE